MESITEVPGLINQKQQVAIDLNPQRPAISPSARSNSFLLYFPTTSGSLYNLSNFGGNLELLRERLSFVRMGFQLWFDLFHPRPGHVLRQI